jgi:hypothetical protein
LNRTKNNLRGSRPYDCKGVRLSLGALFHLSDLRDVPAEQPAAVGALIRQPLTGLLPFTFQTSLPTTTHIASFMLCRSIRRCGTCMIK